MRFGVKAECIQCATKEALIWQKTEAGVLCNGCFEKRKENEKQELVQKLKDEEAQVKVEHIDLPKTSQIVLRKSTRMSRNYKTRSNPYASPKPPIARGRGRRGVLRRAPLRLPPEGRSWMRANRIYIQSGYLRIGDIVNMVGSDGSVYYAQLRGFMVDLFGEKRAVITWLIPTKDYVPIKFNPRHFHLGPDEDVPRRITAMEFECRLSDKDVPLGNPSAKQDCLDNFIIEPVSV